MFNNREKTRRRLIFAARIGLTFAFIVLTIVIYFMSTEHLQKLHTGEVAEWYWEMIKELTLFLTAVVFAHLLEKLVNTLIRDEETENKLIHEMQEAISNAVCTKADFGFNGIDANFSKKSILKTVKHGDEVLILGTMCPNLLEKDILEVLDNKAKIKILTIDPLCDNATFRAKEILDEEAGYHRNPTAYVEKAKTFISMLELIKNKINSDAFDYRIYHDLPCMGVIIIKRKNGNVEAYTSPYLSERATHSPHFMWFGSGKEQCIASRLESYFLNKWDANNSTDAIIFLGGRWRYEMYPYGFASDSGIKYINSGHFDVEQSTSRELRIIGFREETTVNNVIEKCLPTLNWKSKWAWICNDGVVRAEYELFSFSERKGFLILYQNIENNKMILRGTFHIYTNESTVNDEDKYINIVDGILVCKKE